MSNANDCSFDVAHHKRILPLQSQSHICSRTYELEECSLCAKDDASLEPILCSKRSLALVKTKKYQIQHSDVASP